jgi:chromosome partitioning protein
MKKIVISALKGGTGKTVITFNIAALLATEYNKKILIIDIDPQHNMSNIFRQEGDYQNTTSTTEDLFERGIEASELVQKTHIQNIDTINTTLTLTATELRIVGLAGRESILKNWFNDNEEFLNRYDYVFFDCNPTMSILNINVYINADSIILITDIDIDGMQAVSTFLELYYPIQKRIDSKSENNVKGIIINKRNDSTKITKDFLEFAYSDDFDYQDILFENNIHNSTAISETKVNREPINPKRDQRSHNELIDIIEEMKERGVL